MQETFDRLQPCSRMFAQTPLAQEAKGNRRGFYSFEWILVDKANYRSRLSTLKFGRKSVQHLFCHLFNIGKKSLVALLQFRVMCKEKCEGRFAVADKTGPPHQSAQALANALRCAVPIQPV